MLLRAALALSLLCASCASQRPAKSPESPAESYARLAREVAVIRGLPDPRPAQIVVEDPARFARALEAKAEKDGIGPTAADSPAFFAAFELPSPSAKRSSSLDEVMGEQVIAFYDAWTHTVHVRADAVRSEEGDPRMVLAHELAHSLQVQNLPRPDVAGTKEEDTRLAQLAVLEGDAMLVMLAHSAYVRRIPLNRALARASAAVSEDAFQRYAKQSGADRALRSAAPLIRERLTFPYLHGLTFVGALWRAGGFQLVDRMYRSPPVSSEHILHPEKYLAGEMPVAIAAPAVPDGYEPVAQGTVGELATRVILERCLPRKRAESAAAGWGGDAYAIGKRGEHGLLVWATDWDDEREADEFEAALGEYVRCTRSASGTSVMPLDDRIVRAGTRVALVRGLPGEAAEGLANKLAGSSYERVAARPPLGTVRIPPLKPRRGVRSPYVLPGRYVNERLGLMAAVPLGAKVELKTATSATFTLSAPGPALAGIELSDQIAVEATIDEIHGELAGALAKALGKDYALEYTGGQTLFLPALGRGIARAWAVRGTTAGLRATVLPICNGTGSFVLWQLWTEPHGAEALERWLGSVRPTEWREPPVCAELDP